MLRLRVTRLKEICRSWLVCVAVYTINPWNELIVTEYSEELVPTAQVLIKSYRQNPNSNLCRSKQCRFERAQFKRCIDCVKCTLCKYFIIGNYFKFTSVCLFVILCFCLQDHKQIHLGKFKPTSKWREV